MEPNDALMWVLTNRPNEDRPTLATAGGSVASVHMTEALEPGRGIEPLTCSLRVSRSAD